MVGVRRTFGEGLRRGSSAAASVVVLAAACGGESQRTGGGASATGGTGGSVGGDSDRGGTGRLTGGTTGATGGAIGGTMTTGGTAGTGNVGCPEVAPQAYADTCPAHLPDEGCRYELECQSGPREFTYHCAPGGWRLEETACENSFDACSGGVRQVQCRAGSWTLLGTGGDGPADCAVEPPDIGSACSYPIIQSAPYCGYPCPDGSGWTVATCSPPYWLYDGVCEGDCSSLDQALADYSNGHRRCETSNDCRYLYSNCALIRSHCSGALIAGLNADEDEFAALDAELTSCSTEPESGWSCVQCDGLPPALECRDGACVTVQ
jgi:hypothetical protein